MEAIVIFVQSNEPVSNIEQFSKWIQTYQAIIAVFLGVIGWIANHLLTLRAQRQNNLHQLYNTIRLDITSNLREYESFLDELQVYYMHLPDIIKDTNTDWRIEAQSFKKIIDSNNLKWILLLEQYYTLISELELAHEVLYKRSKKIYELSLDINDIFTNEMIFEDYQLIDQERFLKFAGQASGQIWFIVNQMDLVEVLITFLHLKCFSNITGNKMQVKQRSSNVIDDSVKFIINNGTLEFVDGKN